MAALKAAGHDVASGAASSLTAAVTLADQAGNPIDAAAQAAIDAAEATGKFGAEKKATAVATVAEVVVSEAARGGFPAAIADAENFAGLVIEEVLSRMKQTPVVSIGLALLKLLGVGIKMTSSAAAPVQAAKRVGSTACSGRNLPRSRRGGRLFVCQEDDPLHLVDDPSCHAR